ncbi:PAS domain S-box protein [bacterium]|nr:PAS domain S-box protein [bacterium]
MGRISGKRRTARSMFGALALFLSPAIVSMVFAQEPARVLVLHSYHPSFHWTESLQKGLSDRFEESDRPVDLRVEYMDAKHFAGDRLNEQIAALLRVKYEQYPFDLILSCDDDALQFLFTYHDRLFPDVPVVFCGLNTDEFDRSILDGREGYTGVVERIDYASTIDLILEMQPSVKQIALIHDRTVSGLVDRRACEKLAPGYRDVVDFVYPDTGAGLTRDELLDDLQGLDRNTAVYFTGFFRDRDGTPLEAETIISDISRHAAVPVYSIADAYMGLGILGGKLLSAELHGRSTAAHALKVLDGSNPDALPVVVESSNRFMFDHRQLKRFGIAPSRLPEGSLIVHEPTSFYKRHKAAVWWGAAGILALAAFAMMLLVHTFYRRRTEQRLRESEERYRLLADNSNDIIKVLDRDLRFTYVSPAVETLTGYTVSEYVELPLDAVLTEESLERALSSHQGRPEGDSSERINVLEHRRKDGSTWWAETITKPFLNDAGKFVGYLAATRDITKRKQVEDALLESEQFYRDTFHNNQAVKLLIDPANGRIVEANQAACDFYGYSTEQITQLCIWDINMLGEEGTRQRMQQARSGGQVNFEFQHRLASGETRDVLVYSGKVEVAGRILLHSIIVDITERKRAEQKLQKSLLDLSLAQRIANVGNWTYEAETGTVTWSDQVYACLERDPSLGLLTLETFHETMPVHYADQLRNAVESAVKTGEPFDLQLLFSSPDAGEKWLRVVCEPDEAMGPAGHDLHGTVQDITKQVRREKERLAYERHMLQAQREESLSTLAGGIAHDFNNILVGIIGNASLLQDDVDNHSFFSEVLQDVVNAANRAADLSRKMLAYSGKGHFVLKPLELNEAVSEAIRILRPSVPAHIDLSVKRGRDLPAIHADATQMQQITMNLVLNAMEALDTEKGFILVRTSCKEYGKDVLAEACAGVALEPGEFVTLEVVDNGPGMEVDDFSVLFEPFYSSKFTGRGLGLAAVAGIIRGHKGAALVNHTPEHGARFRVLFPARRDLTASSGPETSSAQITKDAIEEKTILLVDDDPVVRTVATRMLERLGGRVLAVRNGREAFETINEKADAIDVVLLDFSLPDQLCREMVRQLKGVDKELPIIVSSGYDEAHVRERMQDTPYAAFVNKPFKIETLRDSLERVLRML